MASNALHVDLINHPTAAATPHVGFRSAVWFWNNHRLSFLADKNSRRDFDQITRTINNGLGAKADCDHRWVVAKHALDAP